MKSCSTCAYLTRAAVSSLIAFCRVWRLSGVCPNSSPILHRRAVSALAASEFTARTAPSGSIVPGAGMPPVEATLDLASVTIVAGGPVWSPLGDYSGECWDAGCGYTGWVESTYAIPTAGNYILEFGVVNWNDQFYDSGLAVDGITVAGQPVSGVPEPSTFALLGGGLAAACLARRLRSQVSVGEGSFNCGGRVRQTARRGECQ